MTDERTCELCPEGTYLVEKATEPSQCLACDSHGICLGGNKVAPKKGQWRDQTRTEANLIKFIKCINPDAC